MYHYFILASILFSIGIYGALTKKRALQIYLSIELMFNAVNIVFISQMITLSAVVVLIIITISALEAVSALALTLALYRHRKNTEVSSPSLK